MDARAKEMAELRHRELRNAGFFCGECHNHLNWPEKPENLVAHMKSVGMDYISLCQGWLTNSKDSKGRDGRRLAQFLRSFSDRETQIRMGAEYPKTRFGHVCWWRFPVISDPFGVYMNYHDSEYFRVAGISEKPVENPSDEVPFLSEAPLCKVARWKSLGGVCMSPHPTSWWMDNKKSNLICTNISADFCLDLLTTRLYDTLVVMGYDAEQIFYQNLWFRLLNLGYRINGAAETDGDIHGRHKIGSLRTYAHCGTHRFNEDKFLAAIKNGRSFVTSGPAIFAKTDKGAMPGSATRCNGETRRIDFTALAAADPDEYISWIVVYKNGRPAKIFDIEKRRLAKFAASYSFKTPKNKGFCWILVKAYGAKRPEKKDFADIMSYCELCEKEVHTEYRELKQVAFTNPFYFHGAEFKEPGAIETRIALKMEDKNGRAIPGAKITVSQMGAERKLRTDSKGLATVMDISPFAEMHIEADGFKSKFASVYLDCPALKKYLEKIYSGKWAVANRNLQPGQVPFGVFDVDGLGKMLPKMEWTIQLEQADRVHNP